MKHEFGLESVRAVREAISHEFENDPAQLIEHYLDMQDHIQNRLIIQGPGRALPIAPP